MIQSNDGGANVSFDGGRTWSTQMNQPTSEIYGVWTGQRSSPTSCTARSRTTARSSSRARPIRTTRDGLAQRARAARPGPIMPHPTRPEHRLRLVQGAVQRDEPEDGPGEELLDRRAVALRQPGERPDPAASSACRRWRLSPHDPERALLRLAVPAPHARQGRDVGEDLARPHGEARRAARARAASRSRATSPARSSTARSTRSPSRRSSAGVIWTGANDGPFHVTRDNGKTWTNVTPKDLPTGRPRAVDRGVAAPHAARPTSRSIATCSATTRRTSIATDDYGKTWTRLTDGKNGIPGRLADARRARGPGSRGPALRRHRVRHVHLVRQRRALAAVPAEPAATCRSPTSRCTARTWSSRRRAARSGSSTTSARCTSSRRRSTPTQPSPLQAARRLSHARRPERRSVR